MGKIKKRRRDVIQYSRRENKGKINLTPEEEPWRTDSFSRCWNGNQGSTWQTKIPVNEGGAF